MLLLREINDLEYDIILNGETDAKTISKENKVTELAIKKQSLPSPEQLNIISLNCPDDIFLEVLMGNIRNSLISFQSWVKKLNTLKKSILVSRINILRGDFLINSNQISELQADLNRLVAVRGFTLRKAFTNFPGSS